MTTSIWETSIWPSCAQNLKTLGSGNSRSSASDTTRYSAYGFLFTFCRKMCIYLEQFVSATVSKMVRPMLRDRCQLTSVLSICNVGVLWPNGWMDQDATWYGGRPRPKQHCDCVRWGPSSSPPHGKVHISRHFLADVNCGQTVAHLSNC